MDFLKKANGRNMLDKELINFNESTKRHAGRQKKHELIANSAQKIIDEFDEYYGDMESNESSSDAGH